MITCNSTKKLIKNIITGSHLCLNSKKTLPSLNNKKITAKTKNLTKNQKHNLLLNPKPSTNTK